MFIKDTFKDWDEKCIKVVYFDNLLSQLNYQTILDQLLNKKNNEDLFQ